MALLSKKNELSVSLFPMFNILVSTLGVLIFIMCSITVLSFGKTKTVRIVQQKRDSLHKFPHHLVWDGNSLILLEKKDTVRFNIDLAKIKTFEQSHDSILKVIRGSETERFFQHVKAHADSEYIVILVRASGFGSFLDLRNFIKQEGIDIGYEPFENSSKIIL